jgi:hypothetical protein
LGKGYTELIKKNFKTLPDEELLKIVKIDFKDYTPEAISLAVEELKLRGISVEEDNDTKPNKTLPKGVFASKSYSFYSADKSKAAAAALIGFVIRAALVINIFVDILNPITTKISVVPFLGSNIFLRGYDFNNTSDWADKNNIFLFTNISMILITILAIVVFLITLFLRSTSKYDKKSKLRVTAIYFLFFILILAVKLVPQEIVSHRFSPYLDQYLAATEAIPDKNAPIHGKMAVIDSNDGRLDFVHFWLNKDRFASKPEEAGTVILLDRSLNNMGQYTSGGDAWMEYCSYSVIDVATGRILYKGEFQSEGVPSTTHNYSESRYINYNEVIDYFNNLKIQ